MNAHSLFPSPLTNKYRSGIELVALILDAVKYSGAARYLLMKQLGINYAQLKKYLKPLTEFGLIEVDIKNGQVLYRASEKGVAFLRQYIVLCEMLSSAEMHRRPLDVICKTV